VLVTVAATLMLCFAVLCRAGRGQRGAMPAGATALAAGHGGGRFNDRRDWRPRRRPGAQREGLVEAVWRHLCLGIFPVRGAGAGDADDAAGDADALDPYLG